jgi:hypothetical protein
MGKRSPRLNQVQQDILRRLLPGGSNNRFLFKGFWEKSIGAMTDADHRRFARFLKGEGIHPGGFFPIIDLLNRFFDRKNLEHLKNEGTSSANRPRQSVVHRLAIEKQIDLWNEFQNQFETRSDDWLKYIISLRLGMFETALQCGNKVIQTGASDLSADRSLADKEMIRAIQSYHNLCVRHVEPKLSEIKRLQVVHAMLKYSSIKGGLIKVQRQLADWLRKEGADWLTAESRVGNGDSSLQARDYAVLINARACLYHRVLFFFPYFMVSPRRTFSGVLPFMRQTLLGLVLSKNNEELKALCKRSSSKMKMLDDSTKVFKARSKEDQEEFDESLREMVINAARQNGELWSLGGYPQLSILEEIVLHGNSMHTGEANAFIATAHDEIYRHGPLPSDRTVSKLLQSSKFRKSSIFVFDPAERQEVMRAIKRKRSSYEVLLISHGQEVPVGIGFSLNLVPWLVKDGTWLKILRQAYNFYIQEKTDVWQEEFGWEVIKIP